MPRRRLVPLLAAVAAVGLASTACAEQSAAIRVGDDTVSEQQLVDEIDAWAGNEALVDPAQVAGELGGADERNDSYIQPLVGTVVQQRVIFMLYDQLFADQGLELTDAERDAGRDQIDNNFGPGVADGFSDDFADDLGETMAKAAKLQQEVDPEELQTELIDLVESTDVELSSRFGSWDEDAFVAGFQSDQAPPAVVPPPAPLPSPDALADPQGLPGE